MISMSSKFAPFWRWPSRTLEKMSGKKPPYPLAGECSRLAAHLIKRSLASAQKRGRIELIKLLLHPSIHPSIHPLLCSDFFPSTQGSVLTLESCDDGRHKSTCYAVCMYIPTYIHKINKNQ